MLWAFVQFYNCYFLLNAYSFWSDRIQIWPIDVTIHRRIVAAKPEIRNRSDTNVPVQGPNRISFLSDSHLSHNASPFRGAGLLIAANSTDAVHFSCSIAGEMRTIGPDRCVDGEIEDGVITYRSWSTFSPLLISLRETRRYNPKNGQTMVRYNL